jgi:hypothetical protein
VGPCILFSVVVNYYTIQRAIDQEAGVDDMRAGSRFLAVLLAAIVWTYAAMSVASRPVAQQAITPSVLDVAASSVVAVFD